MDQHRCSDQPSSDCPWCGWRKLMDPYIPYLRFTEKEDPAVGLYERLAGLRGRISLDERALLSIAFYNLRFRFRKTFSCGSSRHPLTIYLIKLVPSYGIDIGKRSISDDCTKFAWHGERNEKLCKEQEHPGIVLVWSIPFDLPLEKLRRRYQEEGIESKIETKHDAAAKAINDAFDDMCREWLRGLGELEGLTRQGVAIPRGTASGASQARQLPPLRLVLGKELAGRTRETMAPLCLPKVAVAFDSSSQARQPAVLPVPAPQLPTLREALGGELASRTTDTMAPPVATQFCHLAPLKDASMLESKPF